MSARITTKLSEDTTKLNWPIKSAINNRVEDRIDLFYSILICVTNSSNYERIVVADNVSFNGVRFVLGVPLQKGMKLTVQAFDNFSAEAIVRHSTKRPDGNWAIGLEFVRRKGNWVVA